ncbi:MAG: hypothetical protein NNA18_07220 [Nitrospira sp.]|nr:hypothetical protein [Nitrospira sp.]
MWAGQRIAALFVESAWGSFLLSLAIYSAFAALVYLLHGSEPELSVDHIAYFKLANEIMAAHPDGAYWREISVIRSYGVLLAYLHHWTGSHIASLKQILAFVTVFHLLAFELLMTLFTKTKWRAMLFSLLAAVFVSFGASFWGVTDFNASLNRGLVMPFLIGIVWFTLRHVDMPRRHLVYPALVLLSILHLSVYYLIAVLALTYVVEAGQSGFRDRKSLAYFLGGILLAYAAHKILAFVGLTNVQYVGIVPQFAETSAVAEASAAAWEAELFALPWRNMPLPLASILLIVASFGVIFILAVMGAVRCYRTGLTRSDRFMLAFAAAVLVVAYGLQTALWILRQFTAIYPLNFEEVRTINFIMIPSLYFIYRLYSHYRDQEHVAKRAIVPVVIVLLAVFQPIAVLRLMPEASRERVYEAAMESGLVKRSDTLRQLYARQILGLDHPAGRYYYSVRNLLDWMEKNVTKNDHILTDLNEANLLDVKLVGAQIGFLGLAVEGPDRLKWMAAVQDTRNALASGDTQEVVRVARKYEANLAIVPWPVPGALYHDGKYSIFRIPG